jgi:hypothetical protein
MKLAESRSLGDYQPPEEIAENNPQFSVPTLRYLLRDRHENGLEDCCVRVGRRIFLHIPSLLAWLDGQRGGAESPSDPLVKLLLPEEALPEFEALTTQREKRAYVRAVFSAGIAARNAR